jgi:hypothetical protein
VNRLAGPLGAALTCLVVALIAVGCSRSGLDYETGPGNGLDGGYEGSYDDGPIPEGAPPPTCGNGKCDNGETCSTCAVDCGACSSCGNGKCDGTDTCFNCPQDCGDCPACGDGKCQMPEENCQNCAPDCGVCAGCGDHICQSNETCFTCPGDCGNCPGCGDGICQSNETCASCTDDCGPCSVCGNAKCEPPYETCVNCSQDCGQCPTHDCLADLTCILGCFGSGLGGGGGGGGSSGGGFGLGDGGIPLTCLGLCITEGCASAQEFSSNVVNCFVQALLDGTCMGLNINCLMNACMGPIAACIGDHC